jgi:hypothetical protein
MSPLNRCLQEIVRNSFKMHKNKTCTKYMKNKLMISVLNKNISTYLEMNFFETMILFDTP